MERVPKAIEGPVLVTEGEKTEPNTLYLASVVRISRRSIVPTVSTPILPSQVHRQKLTPSFPQSNHKDSTQRPHHNG